MVSNIIGLLVVITATIFNINTKYIINGAIIAAIYYSDNLIVVYMLIMYMIYNSMVKDNMTRMLTYTALFGITYIMQVNDIIQFYLLIELISLVSYLLATSNISSKASITAGINYFTIGSVASTIVLLGISVIYYTTGVTNIQDMIIMSNYDSLIYKLGIVLFVSGIVFKIGIFPFHTWMIQVYTTSPTLVTCFFSIFPKYGLIILLINFAKVFDVTIFSILSMLVGCLGALYEKNIKKILAYSSLAHLGYILIAIKHESITVTVIYLIVYSITVLGIFGMLQAYGKEIITLQELRTIRNPYIKTSIIILMWSLAGLPPCVGFLTKVFIINIAITDMISVAVLIITSIISTVFYINLGIVSNYKSNQWVLQDIIITKENGIVVALTTILTITLIMII